MTNESVRELLRQLFYDCELEAREMEKAHLDKEPPLFIEKTNQAIKNLKQLIPSVEKIREIIYKWERNQRENKGCQGTDVFDLDELAKAIHDKWEEV